MKRMFLYFQIIGAVILALGFMVISFVGFIHNSWIHGIAFGVLSLVTFVLMCLPSYDDVRNN